MRVLIIGNADSIWVKSLVERTHIAFGDDVSILSPKNSVYCEFYSAYHVNVYIIRKIKCALFIINFFKNLSFISKKYDLVTVQYTEKWNAFWGRIASKLNKKLIVSFWGSDLLRLNKPDKNTLLAIKCSSAVTLTTDEMRNKFITLYGEKYSNKIRMTKFGSNGIDYLNNEFDKNEFAYRFGIDTNKVIVSIGYNKMKEQQHLAVLKVINSLPDSIRSKIHIILRLTYGSGDSNYVNQIKDLVALSQCTNTIFEEYLSDKDIAGITHLTDIFIHAQTTDARSASMSEHLYSKCLVINPSWINYPDFEGKVFYLTFKDFDDLKAVLLDNLCKKEQSRYIDKLYENTKTVSDLCSWDSLAPLWRKIYEEK